MIDRAHERMRREGWHLAVCLTDLPLRNGRRPVVADASAMHGVAILSLPALGAARLPRRALGHEPVEELEDRLERPPGQPGSTQRGQRQDRDAVHGARIGDDRTAAVAQ
ncbi:MAG: hypothetical protein QOE69_1649, partial [Thermoleophilaceae bacterium]|nr:hypothetical protein [Thermoleophilaceae bacterium]